MDEGQEHTSEKTEASKDQPAEGMHPKCNLHNASEQSEETTEVTIYKPDFTERYGKRLTPSTVLEYVKQEYPVDENLTERDIEINHEGDYARVVIKRD
jgi:hypothetical protein